MLWRAHWRESDTARISVVFDDHVFISSGWGNGAGLFKIANGNATPIWINKVMKTQLSTPIYAGGHLYGTTDPGELVCVDVKTGKSTWSQKGFEKGGVIAVDDSLIALDGWTGDLVQVELTSAHYRELGRLPAPLGGQSWTTPVAAHGMLLIRNQNALACLAIK